MYTYDDYYDYEEDVINESALDMAVDMSDRYGIAVEDAYAFACDALEGSLKDPRKRTLREENRITTAKNAFLDAAGARDRAAIVKNAGRPDDRKKLHKYLTEDHRTNKAYDDALDARIRYRKWSNKNEPVKSKNSKYSYLDYT